MSSWWLAFLVGSTHAGCAGPGTGAKQSPTTTTVVWRPRDAPPVVVSASSRLEHDAATVRRALPAAAERLRARGLRWRLPVRVVVVDDVAAFVRATGQTTPSLRAWTAWDTVHLLPLQTWQRNDDDVVVGRLAHELCHAAVAQRRQSVADARAHHAPRFVVEGVCSVIAEQGEARWPVQAVQARLADGADVDFGDDSAFSYAFAHHVFAALARCEGDSALVNAVDQTSNGARVQEVLGEEPARWLVGCVEPRSRPQRAPTTFPLP
jgi:hypothetical protein